MGFVRSLIEPVASTTHDQPVHGLLELTDIPGPCVGLEPGNRFRAELDVASIPAVEPLEKECALLVQRPFETNQVVGYPQGWEER